MADRVPASLTSRLMRARLRVGCVFDVSVSLHWSWLPCVLLLVLRNGRDYSSIACAAVEVLAAFSIVLLHELGHVVVARRVGRPAREIVLWPMGASH
jgi:hypothetical protein